MKKLKLSKNFYFDTLFSFKDSFDNAIFSKSYEKSHQFKIFGWGILLTKKGPNLDVILAEPGYHINTDSDDYIYLRESVGLLKIDVKQDGQVYFAEQECHPRLPESAEYLSFFRLLNRCLESNTKSSSLKAVGILYLLSSTYAELVFFTLHLEKQSSNTKRQINIKINSAIKERIGSVFSAHDISSDLGFTIQYLNKVLNEFRGMSLNNYINLYKMENFRHNLLSTKESISALVQKAGYSDSANFIQSFKKTYFVTPLQLRKQILRASKRDRLDLQRTKGFSAIAPLKEIFYTPGRKSKEQRCSLIICNLSESDTLELYWLSPNEDEIPTALIPGLSRIHMGTAKDHCWKLKRDQEVAYFRIGGQNSIIYL